MSYLGNITINTMTELMEQEVGVEVTTRFGADLGTDKSVLEMMVALETEEEYSRGEEEEEDISTTSRFMLFCRKMMTIWETETEENNPVAEDLFQE